MRRRRRGFALLAVLWIMTGIAALGLGLSLSARGAVATARNRMELTRAQWRAEDCVERARAVVTAGLRLDERVTTPAGRPWQHLDDMVRTSSLVLECPGIVTADPVGVSVDVNESTDDALRRLFAWQGLPPAPADSLVEALLDWRDPDDVPRPSGAEREWYERQGRSPPRNGRLASVDELRRVSGFEAWINDAQASRDSLRTLFTIEPGRILLERAPAAVLASLPGVTEETISRLMERRLRGAPPLTELLALGEELSAASRDSLHRHYAELVQRITLEPDAWVLTAQARGSSASGPAFTIELRVVRAGSRAAIVRRRSWP
jgi:general secretion pathway protein K